MIYRLFTQENLNNSPSVAPEVNLVEFENDAERKIATYCLYSSSQKSIEDLIGAGVISNAEKNS